MNFEPVFWDGVQQPRGRVDEACCLEQLEIGLPCPAYRFTVEERWTENQQPILRLTVVTEMDDPVQRYIAQHPVFSRDCRPFVLWAVYDALWMLKLVEAGVEEPRVYRIGLQDSRRGGVIRVVICAQAFYEAGGTPLVHLVNYANTHVFDQLAKVSDTNPAGRPSTEWLGETKDRFYRERAEKAVAEKRQQELNLHRRPESGDPLCLFIDESGDIGFGTAAHRYITCGVAIQQAKVEAVRARVREIIVENWRGEPPKELHFSKMPESKFQPVTESLAAVFLEQAEEAVCFAGFNVDFLRYLLRCEAEFNRLKERPIQTNVADLLANPDGHVGRKHLILTTEELITHFGVNSLMSGASLTIVHDRKHRPWMNAALEKGFERSKDTIAAIAEAMYGRKMHPAMQFTVAASESEPCLWLSDWIAWEFGAWLRDEPFSPAFEKVCAKIRFLTYGDSGEKISIERPGGRPLARYPDWPREIATIL